MPRLLFEKTGNAVWISHLDLMRLFQRAFKRAGLPLTHTNGFNPRPSVSIALPLSVGVESCCELLDFDLDGETVSCEEIQHRLNASLVAGVKVLKAYEDGAKIKHLTFLDAEVTFEYDRGVPENAENAIKQLFDAEEVLVEKRSKTGITDQNIIPMIKSLVIEHKDTNTLVLHARVCCQNPTLNPMQLHVAVCRHLSEYAPDFVKVRRLELYREDESIFR